MKRETVQDFLNLPGIAGLALMGKRSRPFFHGVDGSLNFQQKEVLVQGIQQIIDTTPANFEEFEFQFSSHQVYLYKLDHGTTLLVVTTNRLTDLYAPIVQQFKRELQQDVGNTIAMFRLLVNSPTLSGENYWKPSNAKASERSTILQPLKAAELDPQAKNEAAVALSSILPGFTPQVPPQPIARSDTSDTNEGATSTEATVGSETVVLQEMLVAMNGLSRFATQYLGPVVVTNYWKTTRPNQDWVQHLTVERSAQLVYSPDSGLTSSDFLTTVQQQWLQEWVAAFIDRCAKVIRDFPKTARQSALDDRQKWLLLRE
jgi:hypothetical protein